MQNWVILNLYIFPAHRTLLDYRTRFVLKAQVGLQAVIVENVIRITLQLHDHVFLCKREKAYWTVSSFLKDKSRIGYFAHHVHYCDVSHRCLYCLPSHVPVLNLNCRSRAEEHHQHEQNHQCHDDANEEEEGFALSLSLVALAHRGHCNPCADDLDDVTDDGRRLAR